MPNEPTLATRIEESSSNLQLKTEAVLSNACPLSQRLFPLAGHLNPSNYAFVDTTSSLEIHLSPCEICQMWAIATKNARGIVRSTELSIFAITLRSP